MSRERTLEEPAGDRIAYSFDQLRDTGILWLINASVFHPRGVALALDYADGEDQPRGWSLMAAGNDEPWTFVDSPRIDDRFRAARAVIEQALADGRAPTTATEPTEETP